MNEVPSQHPGDDAVPDVGQRLAACLSSSRLFSLDPDHVLRETAATVAELLPGAQVSMIALTRPGAATPELDEQRRRLLGSARDTRATSCSDDRSTAVVPLMVRRSEASPSTGTAAVHNKVVGAAVIDGGRPLPRTSLALVELLADRAAVALEHAVLYETQARIAQQLQRRVMPIDPPHIDGLEIGVLFRSHTDGAMIGGDFVDFVSLSPNQVAVTVGDVSGKGIGAAAGTVIVKYALRAIITTLSWPTWPGEALRDLHNALQDQLDETAFATVVLGLVDVGRRTLSVASAGHPAPIIVRGDSAAPPLVLNAPAIALTDFSELDAFPTERLDLEPGDLLFFYTDGLAELRDPDGVFYEEHALLEELRRCSGRPADKVVECVHAHALSFSARPPHDDIALIAIRFVG